MSRYITTKADFTLRRKHKTGSGYTIYENDYTTINPLPNAGKGEYVIGDSNFVFTTRLGINSQKKHVRGKFVQNPIGESNAWTIDTMIDSSITQETKIRLRPDYTNIRDFACYGSAVKLVQGTVNGVITDFPAEMYLGFPDDEHTDTFELYAAEAGYALVDDYHQPVSSCTRLYNEYGIDIIDTNIQAESVENQLRYLTLCGTSYEYLDSGETSYGQLVEFSVTGTSLGSCYQGKDVWIDKLADVDLKFENNKSVRVYVFKDNKQGAYFYSYTGGDAGAHIRPKKEIVEEYFKNCDDFTAVLLNRENKPIYTASFETPFETETGFSYNTQTYTWPSLLGGYNPDLSGPYFPYLESLMNLSEFMDEYYTDNMWKSLTHEAIKTLDWTYVSNTDGEVEDLSAIDTSRIEPIIKIYGRQFDDLKRYIDGIKTINTITYNRRSNTPDYTLTDVLENSGWETRTLKLSPDNNLRTDNLYSGLTSGYTATDANNEFFRRLKLNSKYLFSVKGTRKGLDSLLALFGFTPEDYSIHEYVSVFSGDKNNYGHFCNKTEGMEEDPGCPEYPLAEDVKTINRYKTSFDGYDPYGPYCGIPVTEVGYFPQGGDTAKTYSYVIPWFSYGKNYDDGLYFQRHGGWGKKAKMEVSLEIASAVTEIYGDNLYTETQARIKFAKNFDELLQQAYTSSHVKDIFYVTDISKIVTDYSAIDGEDIVNASHYFILENQDFNQFLGYSVCGGTYGWRSIAMSEIEQPNSAGTLVLYMESIMDDTTGNNPHVGNGTYDNGMSYVTGMSEIFAYSILNKNFIGIDDSTCEKIKNYKFDVEFQEDNRKCWFFSDDYTTSYGKNVDCYNPEGGETIEFREADVTDVECDIKRTYEVTDLLTNKALPVDIGSNAKNNFSTEWVWEKVDGEKKLVEKDYTKIYNRVSETSTFNPENSNAGESTEPAANSIVNLKNIIIDFTTPDNIDEKDFRRYVENTVIPYLTQMIPSSSILTWSFDGDALELIPPAPPTPPGPEPPVPPQPVEPTIEITAEPEVISSNGGTVRYNVNVNPKNTRIKVKYGDTEKEAIKSSFKIPKNESTEEEKFHVISAWCVDYPSVWDTVEIRQEKAEPEEVTHKLFLSPLSRTIEYNGNVHLTAMYRTYINGTEDISAAKNVTTDTETIWRSSNEYATVDAGLVKGNNKDTENNHDVDIKATYKGTSEEIPSTITVKKKSTPVEPTITYKLVLSPTTGTIECDGRIQLTATYKKYIDGIEDTSAAQDVTSLATWSASNEYASVVAGLVEGNNDSFDNKQRVEITAKYNDTIQERKAVITVKKKPYIRIVPEHIITGLTGGTNIKANLECNADWIVTSVPDWIAMSDAFKHGSGNKEILFHTNRLLERIPTAGTIVFQVVNHPELVVNLLVETVLPITTQITLRTHIPAQRENAEIVQLSGNFDTVPTAGHDAVSFSASYHYVTHDNQTGETVQSVTLAPLAELGQKCKVTISMFSIASDLMKDSFGYIKFTAGDGSATWQSEGEFHPTRLADQFNAWWENGGNYRNTDAFCNGIFEFFPK